MAAAALVFWGIKKLKKGRGSTWLRDLIYWYLPTSLLKDFFTIFRTLFPAVDQVNGGEIIMEHGARLSTTRVIAIGYVCLGAVAALSLTTNIIQGINNYRLQNEQKVAITPMLFNAPFAVSQNQADASLPLNNCPSALLLYA